MSVKNLDVHPRYIQALLKARVFDVRRLLHLTKFEVEKETGLSRDAVASLYQEAAKCVYTTPSTSAWDIINGVCDPMYKHGKLTTGCMQIDVQLKGGIIFPGITEISGESSSGKTQLCIQLCLSVQKPISEGGIGAGALYICTEDAFPNKRLEQMAHEFSRLNGPVYCGGKEIKLTDQIYIEHAVDLDDLWSILNIRIHPLLLKHNVKLIIIDSIAALFRAEFNLGEIQARAKMLAKFGQLLHNISQRNNMCVICVNQVSDDIDGVSKEMNDNDNDGSRSVIPALGSTWSYFVNTRLMLSRTQWKTSMFPTASNKNQVVPSHEIAIRTLKVIHAPHLPQSKSYFVVDQGGVKDFQIPER